MQMEPRTPRVIIVDDDVAVGRTVMRALASRGFEVEHVATPEAIEDLLARRVLTEDWDAIVLDISIGELNGLDVLARLRSAGNRTAVVMLTGDDTATTATAALRGGAFHYLTKPLQPRLLCDTVDLAVRHTAVHRDLARPDRDEEPAGLLVGNSAAMTELRRMVVSVADANVSVLIVGESGTGKEVVARALHQASPRARKAFVPLNCGAIPEGLIDSERGGGGAARAARGRRGSGA